MIKHLDAKTFKEEIFNYEENQEWQYKGERPCVIDFYADWCAPCKSLTPVIEELAEEYEGKVDFYKIDTENEKELAQIFGIQSIPTLLFVPLEGMPQMARGALPKESFVKAFKDVFNIEATAG